MRTRTTLLLVTLVTLGGGAVYLYTRGGPSAGWRLYQGTKATILVCPFHSVEDPQRRVEATVLDDQLRPVSGVRVGQWDDSGGLLIGISDDAGHVRGTLGERVIALWIWVDHDPEERFPGIDEVALQAPARLLILLQPR